MFVLSQPFSAGFLLSDLLSFSLVVSAVFFFITRFWVPPRPFSDLVLLCIVFCVFPVVLFFLLLSYSYSLCRDLSRYAPVFLAWSRSLTFCPVLSRCVFLSFSVCLRLFLVFSRFSFCPVLARLVSFCRVLFHLVSRSFLCF